MISIAYVSAATDTMTDDDVAAILVQARANNLGLGLTGALLYHRGRFIQILEGPAEQVHARYDIIAADPRHRSVQKISEKFIAERQFPEWTMGFRPLSDDSFKTLTGFDDFFDARTGRSRLKYAENEAAQFLEWLAEYWLSRA
ncbi:FAD-dependent sensor of blue light [Glaciihabitans tibetensis]|uniref:FAD-dependent sensor of blue light n=1 Tax=Glaciihabitans tibetensis TaxID=1266600 RepID=A0A2T0VDP8_9MICO|nr:BLUF domain-containing protein [Glaciihabitans tibetensis]PRY68308.1 FAD-dependent sensor of blue light [Glaciihabitans tibetensis]